MQFPWSIQATATLSGNNLVVQEADLKLPNQVLALDDFRISWYVLEPGVHYNANQALDPQIASWIGAGQTGEPLYITNKAPIKGTKLFQTVVRLGTAEMPAGATDDSITQAVMDKFGTLEIHKVGNAAQGLDGGPILTYWNDYIASNARQTSTALLKNNDGSCVAWTNFFLDILAAQGITGKGDVVGSKNKSIREQIFVAQWNAVNGLNGNNTDAATKTQFPYFNSFNVAPNQPVKEFIQPGGKWDYNWDVKGIVFDTNPANYLNAQGESVRAQPPLAQFLNHVVAEITINNQPMIFDPSYGKPYTLPASPAIGDLIKSMDDPAVIPFYGATGTTANGVRGFFIRKNPGDKSTLVLWERLKR